MSIICDMRSMPSVVTFRTCVSPRLNSAEPCARCRTPTSAESGRMSVARAAVQADALVDHALAHDLLLQLLPRGTELARACREASSPSTDARCSFASAFSASSFASRSALSGTMALAEPVLGERARRASYMSSPYSGVGSNGSRRDADARRRTPAGTRSPRRSRAWRPRAPRRRSPRSARWRRRRAAAHVFSGASPSIIRMSISPGVVAATGDDDVERRLLGLLERRVHDPLAADQADADRADRTVERQAGEAGGDGRRVHRGDVVRVLPVHADRTVMTTWTSSR